MADEQPPAPEGDETKPQPSNVVPLEKAILRRRVLAAIDAGLEHHAPVCTADVTAEMIELEIGMSQIFFGMKRADILEFSEDIPNGSLTFTARLLSSGEEFFVTASVEHMVPFAWTVVAVRRVWRL